MQILFNTKNISTHIIFLASYIATIKQYYSNKDKQLPASLTTVLFWLLNVTSLSKEQFAEGMVAQIMLGQSDR